MMNLYCNRSKLSRINFSLEILHRDIFQSTLLSHSLSCKKNIDLGRSAAVCSREVEQDHIQ